MNSEHAHNYYVCVYAHIHVCMCITCTCEAICAYIHVRVRVRGCILIHICILACHVTKVTVKFEQNSTHVHSCSCAMRISAGPSETVCYSKCLAQCAGSCMTVIVCFLPQGRAWELEANQPTLVWLSYECIIYTQSRVCSDY